MKNLQNLTFEELKEERAAIDAELQKRQSKEKSDARKKIVELAQSHGIKLDELAEQTKMYVNPENPWEKWAGRGRKPKWLVAALKEGKTLEELEVS